MPFVACPNEVATPDPNEVMPVPPYPTPIVVPCHVPVPIVPIVTSDGNAVAEYVTSELAFVPPAVWPNAVCTPVPRPDSVPSVIEVAGNV